MLISFLPTISDSIGEINVMTGYPTKNSLIAKWTNSDTRGLTGYSMKYYEMCYNQEENEYYDCVRSKYSGDNELSSIYYMYICAYGK